jgi:hypothetical protein
MLMESTWLMSVMNLGRPLGDLVVVDGLTLQSYVMRIE